MRINRFSTNFFPQKKGFTLIELLVVVAIIALLISILIPALHMAKRGAQKIICSTNERGIVETYLTHAQGNDGRLPLMDNAVVGNWEWDLKLEFIEPLMENTGITKENFYCPLGKKKPNSDWWPWGTTSAGDPFAVVSYLILTDSDDPITPEYGNVKDKLGSNTASPHHRYTRIIRNSPIPPVNEHRQWIDRVQDVKGPTSDYELVIDTTLSFPKNGTHPLPPDMTFEGLKQTSWVGCETGGSLNKLGITDDTNHYDRRYIAEDGTIGFLDGHVSRRKIQDMHAWFMLAGTGNPIYVWY